MVLPMFKAVTTRNSCLDDLMMCSSFHSCAVMVTRPSSSRGTFCPWFASKQVEAAFHGQQRQRLDCPALDGQLLLRRRGRGWAEQGQAPCWERADAPHYCGEAYSKGSMHHSFAWCLYSPLKISDLSCASHHSQPCTAQASCTAAVLRTTYNTLTMRGLRDYLTIKGARIANNFV